MKTFKIIIRYWGKYYGFEHCSKFYVRSKNSNSPERYFVIRPAAQYHYIIYNEFKNKVSI
jgi:hypothetical protein